MAKMKGEPKLARGIDIRLKTWRSMRGFSQSDAAKALGVPKRTLQDWEQGRRRPRGLSLNALYEKMSIEADRLGMGSSCYDLARELRDEPGGIGASGKSDLSTKKAHLANFGRKAVNRAQQ